MENDRSRLIEADGPQLGNVTASAPPAPDSMIYPRLPTPGIIQSNNSTMATAKYKCKKRILAQGIMQILFGSLLVLFYVMLLSANSYDLKFGLDGSGIWAGLLSIIAGAFGIATFVNPSKCRRVSHMILCVFTACCMIFCIGASAFWCDVVLASRMRCEENRGSGSYDYFSISRYYCPDIAFPFGLAVASVIIAFATCITSIVSAAMVCCNNSRCCCRCCCCCLGANEEMAIGVVGNDGNTVCVAMPLGGAAAASGTTQFHGTSGNGMQKVIVVQQAVA